MVVLNTKMILMCLLVTLLSAVNSETVTKEPPTEKVNNTEFEALNESIQTLRDHFISALETVDNKTLPKVEFINFLFPELEDGQKDDLIKEDINQLTTKAIELTGQLDKNEDGQITMDEVLTYDSDRKIKIDQLLKEIAEIHIIMDDKFGDQDGELFEEDMAMDNGVPYDPDVIDLDENGEPIEEDLENREDLEDFYDFHDEL